MFRLPFTRRAPATLTVPRAAAVQAHDLGIRGLDPQSGALLLQDGTTRRHILQIAAQPFGDDAQAMLVLSQVAAALNGLRSTVSLLVWGEPTGLAAPIAALERRLEAPALTGARRALAVDHLATLRTLHTRQSTSKQPAPRSYRYYLTVDGPTTASAMRDADDLAQAFGATVLDAPAALAVLRRGWRAAPLLAPGGRATAREQVWIERVDARTGQPTDGLVLHVSPNGTRLERTR